jgi:hypothetical protein
MADEARLVPPTEATAILRALKPYEEAEAKKRQQAG